MSRKDITDCLCMCLMEQLSGITLVFILFFKTVYSRCKHVQRRPKGLPVHVSDGTTATRDHTRFFFFKLCKADANMSKKDLKVHHLCIHVVLSVLHSAFT